MAQAPPILVWQPGGGVSSPIGSNPPVYTQAGSTALVEDQQYVDVVFGSIQTTDEWVLGECVVVNETDVDPLNIWPGIITDKTAAGFRIYFNGLPDSGNYYLHWSVSGINIEPSLATTYFLTGPSSVTGDEAATYTVSLPPSTYVSATVTVTPAEGGLEIGVFSPETVTLTTDSPSKTFTFTPSIYGDTTITVNNDRSLTDPADLDLTVVAPTYTLDGPSGGDSGVASTDFTVELSGAAIGTVTVTPADAADGGVFAPTTVALTTLAPSDTFSYTPASGGTKTISVTNDGGLADPTSLSYLSVAPFSPTDITGLKLWLKADSMALSDGTAVGTWADQSGNGNDATQATAGSKPLFKTNRVNSLPALDFDGTDDCMSSVMPGTITTAASVFIVQRKNASSATLALLTFTPPSTPNPPTNSFEIYLPYNDGTVYFDLGDTTSTGRVNAAWGGSYGTFYAWSFVAGSGNMAIYRNGTSVVSSGGHSNFFTQAGLTFGINGFATVCQDSDIAEILVYNTELGTTDRQSVENYLLDKYGL